MGPLLIALGCSCRTTCNGEEWDPSCNPPNNPPENPCAITSTSPAADDVRFRPASWTMLPWVELEGSLEQPGAVASALRSATGDAFPLGGVVLDEPPLGTFTLADRESGEDDRLSREVRESTGHMIVTLSPALAPGGGTTLVGTEPGRVYPKAEECGWLADAQAPFESTPGTDLDGGALRLDLSTPEARSLLVLGQRSLLRGASGMWMALPEERATGGAVSTPEDLERFCESVELLLGNTSDRVDGLAMLAPTLRGPDGRPIFCRATRGLGAATRGHSADAAGLAESIEHMLLASSAGFRLVGSRIGGDAPSRDGSPFDRVVFGRWLAASALSPVMLLRLGADGKPAGVPPDQATEMDALFKEWAFFHASLAAYQLTEARATAPTNVDLGPVIVPLGDPKTFAQAPRWMFGRDLLVAPALDASGERDVELPSGRWFSFWDDAFTPLDGDTTIVAEEPNLNRIPLYARDGAILPLLVPTGASTPTPNEPPGEELMLHVFPSLGSTALTKQIESTRGYALAIEVTRVTPSGPIRITSTTGDVNRTLVHRLRVAIDGVPEEVRLGDAPLARFETEADVRAAGEGWAPYPSGRAIFIATPARAQVIIDIPAASP